MTKDLASASMHEDDVPPGFVPFHTGSNTFISLCGPFYSKDAEGGAPIMGMRVLPKHLNLRGIPHGGLMVTLADSALGFAINHRRGGPLSVVTVSLTTDFVEIARLGDWVEAHVDIQRIGARMAFANCFLSVGKRRILRASGVFAIVKPVQEPARG